MHCCEKCGWSFVTHNDDGSCVEEMGDFNKSRTIISDNAFDRAIAEGRLSENESDRNYAGDYMFMGHNEKEGKDLFKNSNTRRYDV